MTGLTVTWTSGPVHQSRTWSASTKLRVSSTRASWTSCPSRPRAASERCTCSTTCRALVVELVETPAPPLVEPSPPVVELVETPPARSSAVCRRASSPAAWERRTSNVSVEPQASRSEATRRMACSRSRASAASMLASTWTTPLVGSSTPRGWRWMSKCRASAGVQPLHLGGLGVEPDLRLGHQPVQLTDPDRVRERSDLGVDERGTGHGQVLGALRDPPGPPHLDLTAGDPDPQPRHPVTDLDRVTDQAPPGVGGPSDRGRELDDRELRDRRRTDPGQLDEPVMAREDVTVGAVGVRHDPLRVQISPRHRRAEQPRLRHLRRRPARPGEGQHRLRVVALLQGVDGGSGGGGHALILFEHLF